jgi:hypothetical protein
MMKCTHNSMRKPQTANPLALVGSRAWFLYFQ